MDSKHEELEEQLSSRFVQLKSESAILDRIVYKGKNQHRRAFYFQYLMKVRRDLKLLQSLGLEDILKSLFQVINRKNPVQKLHFLESLKNKTNSSGKHNFLERLLGAARLLSQMIEPILKASIQISSLLARTFFTGFTLMNLAVLARLRVLLQQILLDVVSVYNMISDLSQTEHSVELTQGGLEVFRDYNPPNEEFLTLKCSWEGDKFVLHEIINQPKKKNQDVDLSKGVEISSEIPNIKYQSIEVPYKDDEYNHKNILMGQSNEDQISPSVSEKSTHKEFTEKSSALYESSGIENTGNGDHIVDELPDIEQNCKFSTPKAESRSEVAFVSVRRTTSSEVDTEFTGKSSIIDYGFRIDDNCSGGHAALNQTSEEQNHGSSTRTKAEPGSKVAFISVRKSALSDRKGCYPRKKVKIVRPMSTAEVPENPLSRLLFDETMKNNIF